MKSLVIRRSISIRGRKTTVSLEDAFWSGLKEIASSRDLSLSATVAAIEAERVHGNLSSAIRLYVLEQFRAMIGKHGRECQEQDRSQEISQVRSTGFNAA